MATTLTLRQTKGSPLSYNEMDSNLQSLDVNKQENIPNLEVATSLDSSHGRRQRRAPAVPPLLQHAQQPRAQAREGLPARAPLVRGARDDATTPSTKRERRTCSHDDATLALSPRACVAVCGLRGVERPREGVRGEGTMDHVYR